MKQIIKMYGGAVLYGICLIMVLVMVFCSTDANGNEGILAQIGQMVNVSWKQDDDGGFNVYKAECAEEFPDIVYQATGALTTGTYDIDEVITASDGAGNALECRVRSIRYPRQADFIKAGDSLKLIFDKSGIYELEISAKDSDNRETIKRIVVPVNK